jgi:hypothetical protein
MGFYFLLVAVREMLPKSIAPDEAVARARRGR